MIRAWGWLTVGALALYSTASGWGAGCLLVVVVAPLLLLAGEEGSR